MEFIIELLIVIDLGHLKVETLRMSHINQNALYRQKFCPHTSAINHERVPFISN